jgi:hypothetical protein
MSLLPACGPLLAALLALACEAATEPSSPDELGRPGDVKRGQVTVSMEQAKYKEGAVVSARIANGLDGTIYAEDSKSDCSIAMLERREGETWSRVPGCSVERIPAIVAIGPGRTRTASIDPLSRHFGVTSGSPKPAFGAGLYRIRFSYRLKPEASASDPPAVFSETFRIEP